MALYNPKVVTPSDFDDNDFDFEYFSRTYKPLSNLPTPPPSSRNSASSSPVIGLDDDENIDSSLLGPAVHLVNLHPPSASIASPSIALVQAIITRAALPIETIALAVCILDSLDSKFSRKWRISLPLAPSTSNKRHTISAATSITTTHIDSVSPEIIILTALIIAFKFTEDCQEPTHYYASDWGKGLWTCDQINVTERCIMEHLSYRILPLCDRAIIEDAMEDMKRAGRMTLRERDEAITSRMDMGHLRSISVPLRSVASGEAMLGLGLQLTPVDTPINEGRIEFGMPQ